FHWSKQGFDTFHWSKQGNEWAFFGTFHLLIYMNKEPNQQRNQAFGKVYDEVYREELCKVEELIKDRRRAEAELFFESGQELTEAIRKTWTDEMQAGFGVKSRLEEEVTNIIIYLLFAA
ncbi:hypothetical protein Tco_0419710, partial [Tanacetum coccineum]